MRTKAMRSYALLRAEWLASGVPERATAIRLTPSSVFVVTDALPDVGARLELLLSFGRRGSSGVFGRVASVHLSVEPGNPAGFAFDFESDAVTAAAVEALLLMTTQLGRSPRRSVRVLHADRSTLLRDMFGYAFEKYFRSRPPVPVLDQVASIASAEDAAARDRPDIAIIDHELADGAGEEVVRFLRARAGRSCWIVGVGVASSLGRCRMLDAGADVYLQKPIALPELLGSVELVTQEGLRGATGAA